jgi:large subunit ribosomal protein L2
MIDNLNLLKKKALPIRFLTVALKKTSGRSSLTGHITVRHKGGGHKRRYRLIDFFRSITEWPAYLVRTEYDPNRNAYVGLVVYGNGVLSYIIQPQKLEIGQLIASSFDDRLPIQVGNACQLQYIPIGTFIHNVQLKPFSYAKIARAAGAFVQVLKRSATFTLLRLPSSEIRYVSSKCIAVIGAVSNPLFRFHFKSKAGQNRWLGKRPRVRGVAMNPIDHPHGGGQGKTSGGRPSVSPWAIQTKGYKTVKNYSKLIFKRRIK